MQLFFVEHINENQGVLTPDDSRHAVKVLRKTAGDYIHVTDGKQKLYKVQITEPHPKKCAFRITEETPIDTNRNYRLHIAVAPTKSIDRFEWFLEKAVETGIDEITPVYCSRSERKRIKPDRCKRVIKAAAKQSHNYKLPLFHDPVSLEAFIKNTSSEQAVKLIAWCEHPEDMTPVKSIVERAVSGSDREKIIALVGPEGDFTPEEAAAAQSAGFVPVTLGKSRLRTETAALYICTTAHILQPLKP